MSNELKIRFADIQADYFQKKLNSGLIIFPYLDLPFDDYKRFIDQRFLRTNDLSTIFVLDMRIKYRNFEKLFNYIIQKEQPTVLLLIYQTWEKSIPHHSLINRYFDNERTAFFACQVERIEPESNTSHLHSVVLGGIDLVSLQQIRGYSNNCDLNLNKIKLIDEKDLSISRIEDTINDLERNIIEEFDIPPQNENDINHIDRILHGYRGALVNPTKFQILYYLARTHEAIVSTRVFQNFRNSIKNREVKQHIENTRLRMTPIIKQQLR
jgi:hypothetical protein